jgi:nucleoside-diphosphate-sugar epimerase
MPCLRPTSRGSSRTSLVATGRTRIFGSGGNAINFVSADDVARLVDLSNADNRMRQTVVEAPGPANLTFDQLAAAVESVTGRTGVKQHLSPAIMRVAAAVTGVVNPVLSAQINAALVMNERDMTVDGPAIRAAYPSIPMTTAAEVATQLFGDPVATLATTA